MRLSAYIEIDTAHAISLEALEAAKLRMIDTLRQTQI